MAERDEFPMDVRRTLAARVGTRCSRPACGRDTSGPQVDDEKAINLGVAAHITAAAPGGPRYDVTLSLEERTGPANGIWLCQSCAKLVDNDEVRYPADLLRRWKRLAEEAALLRLEDPEPDSGMERSFRELEELIPSLLDEMATDVRRQPVVREFILKTKGSVYSHSQGHPVFEYYYETHPSLVAQVLLLLNHGLAREITYNNTPRFVMIEELARYLRRRPVSPC